MIHLNQLKDTSCIIWSCESFVRDCYDLTKPQSTRWSSLVWVTFEEFSICCGKFPQLIPTSTCSFLEKSLWKLKISTMKNIENSFLSTMGIKLNSNMKNKEQQKMTLKAGNLQHNLKLQQKYKLDIFQ